MLRVHSIRLPLSAIAAVASIAACSAKGGGSSDSAATTANGNAPARRADSATMPGTMQKDSGSTGGMARMGNMTGNADHDFLRMMSDHHKGLILMVHATIESKDKLSVKPIANRMDKAQDAELDRMMTMLEKDYKDPYAPKVMPEHKAMADELKAKSGAAYDRAFLTNVIKHHQEAITMIDGYLPKAKQAKVKRMAERMKAAQTKEIAEMQAKLATMKS